MYNWKRSKNGLQSKILYTYCSPLQQNSPRLALCENGINQQCQREEMNSNAYAYDVELMLLTLMLSRSYSSYPTLL